MPNKTTQAFKVSKNTLDWIKGEKAIDIVLEFFLALNIFKDETQKVIFKRLPLYLGFRDFLNVQIRDHVCGCVLVCIWFLFVFV